MSASVNTAATCVMQQAAGNPRRARTGVSVRQLEPAAQYLQAAPLADVTVTSNVPGLYGDVFIGEQADEQVRLYDQPADQRSFTQAGK